MTAEIVPVDNMAALDTLDAETRERAITSYIEQANSWLAHADIATARTEDIANFKAYTATVAEASRRLKVSKEAQMHAALVVRRSERALGLSIRAGQERGEVRTKGQRSDRPSVDGRDATFFSHATERQQTYAVTDDVTDEQFDEALDRAEAEQNPSRANVVRKVREVQSGTEARQAKWDRIAEMAERGYASAQIAREVGMTEAGLRQGARDRNIEIRADRIVGKSRRLDMRRVLDETVGRLESIAETTTNLVTADGLAAADITWEEAQAWVDSLASSITALSKVRKTIRESIS